MRPSVIAHAAVVLAAAAGLPGCIAVIGGDRPSRVETPTGETLTKLEKRMDRIDERLGKRVE